MTIKRNWVKQADPVMHSIEAPRISRALAEDIASRFVRPYLKPGDDRDSLFHQQGAWEAIQYVLQQGGHSDLLT